MQEAQIESDRIVAKLQDEDGKKGESLAVERIPNMDERALLESMEKQHVVVSGQEPHGAWWAPLAWTVLPLLALPLILALHGRRAWAAQGGPSR